MPVAGSKGTDPPEKFLISSSKLPTEGSYLNGVVKLITISKSLGPDPVSKLNSANGPMGKTTVSSPPTRWFFSTVWLSGDVNLKLPSVKPM